jgi:hypothetical protein
VADVPPVAELLADGLDDPPELDGLVLPELQAARVSTVAAKVVVIHHRLRITCLHSHKLRYNEVHIRRGPPNAWYIEPPLRVAYTQTTYGAG